MRYTGTVKADGGPGETTTSVFHGGVYVYADLDGQTLTNWACPVDNAAPGLATGDRVAGEYDPKHYNQTLATMVRLAPEDDPLGPKMDLDETYGPPREGATAMPVTMILAAEVQSVSRDPQLNILKVQVPGEDRQRLVHFDPTKLDVGLKARDALDVEANLVPAERIELLRLGLPGTLGHYTTNIPQDEALPEVDNVAPEALHPGIRYVAPDPHYIPPVALAEYSKTFEKLSRAGRRVFAQLIGPAGCGKTSLAYGYAATYNRPFAKIDMGTITSPDELLGVREFRDGRTEYTRSLLVEALGTPRCVILLDEINRLRPGNEGPLYPLLDHTGEVWSDYLQTTVRCDPSVIIFGTANVGLPYTGTNILDAALESRFKYPIEVTYPAAKDEAAILVRHTGIPEQTARLLAEFANEVRALAHPDLHDALERDISTRALIAVADLVAMGLAPYKAIEHCILPRYDATGGTGSPRQRVEMVLQSKFGK